MTGADPGPRTQGARRVATRTALLDATIECLIVYGYPGTTTARIAERAGVSRGAQIHHFHTKAELVAEALHQLAERRAMQLVPSLERLPAGAGRVTAGLDLLWDAHTDPLFDAALELWVAARTDDELRAQLAPVERDVISRLRAAGRPVFDPHGEIADLDTWLDLALGTMRGLAMQRSLQPPDRRAPTAREWARWRERLAALLRAPAFETHPRTRSIT